MSVRPSTVACAAVVLLFVGIATAQGNRLDLASHLERQRVQKLAGVDGLPAPPPVYRTSDFTTMEFADRYPYELTEPPVAASASEIVEVVLPAGPDGTGTDFAEVFEYQLGSQYDPDGPARPLVIAYHGYSNSASSVALLSTLDEECEARGWIYMAVTGIVDQVFGTLDGQQNVEAAIEWMIDNHRVDEQRLYMVGFSMGAGVVANFAARHRDPDDVMIAAIGLVSGSFDWTMTHDLGSGDVENVLEADLNFGAGPADVPFAYKRSSALHFDPATYPIYPGTLMPLESMALNLASTPAYITWDSADPLPLPEKQNKRLVDLLEDGGATIEVKIANFTLNPNTGFPAAHSWYVLKEKKLFTFLEQHRAKRTPRRFEALVDGARDVSFAEVTPRSDTAFAHVVARVVGPELRVAASGTSEVSVNGPALVSADTPNALQHVGIGLDREGFMLRTARWDDTPDYALDDLDTPLLGTAPRLADRSLALPVPGLGSVNARVTDEPTWSAALTTDPSASIGTDVLLALATDAEAASAWLVFGPREELISTHSGLSLSVPPVAPNQVIAAPLVSGTQSFTVPLPVDPALVGVTLRAQAIVFDAAGAVTGMSNAQRVDVTP